MANAFVSALKKIGQVVLKGLQIVEGIVPVVEAAAPGLATNSTFENIMAAITDVETGSAALQSALSQPGLTSQQKLVMATAIVAQELSTALAGKKIANPALFQQGAQEITQGAVDIYNSIEDSAIVTTGNIGTPAAPSANSPATATGATVSAPALSASSPVAPPKS
jgi:hypothetical protein